MLKFDKKLINFERNKKNYHVRIYSKVDFVLAQHQKSATYGSGYKLKMQRLVIVMF